MLKTRLIALGLLVFGVILAFGIYTSETNPTGPLGRFPFKLGLDLNGGTHLVYRADTSKLASGDIASSMRSLQDVIERRVNLFGVSEPIVQTEEGGGFGGAKENRLIVELPGITDIDKAVALIGETPLLEFRLYRPDAQGLIASSTASTTLDSIFEPALLTGRYVERASLQFDQQTNEPLVSLTFNSEGKDIFAKLTRENVGKQMPILLDGVMLSDPVIREEIAGGVAQISGSFTPESARELVRNLNYGALPVPIELIGTQTIGPSLGAAALEAGVWSGIFGFILVSLFLILWYRLPGFIAVLALCIYSILMLVIFKLIPVTLTAAGLAGFILSIGMAVDANILIFERMKEELKRGHNLEDSIREGFARAWLSIRDSNLSSMITAVILYWFGTTSVVKGFALVFGIGVLVSMFTAITVTRTFLLSLGMTKGAPGRMTKFLFGNGFTS